MSDSPPRKYAALGDAIHAARERQNISQAELALRSDVGQSFIGHIELGLKRPRQPTLKRIARALNVDYVGLAILARHMDEPAGEIAVRTTPEKASRLRRLEELSLSSLDEVLAIVDALAHTRLGRAITEPMLEAAPNPEAERNRRPARDDTGNEADDGGDEQRA